MGAALGGDSPVCPALGGLLSGLVSPAGTLIPFLPFQEDLNTHPPPKVETPLFASGLVSALAKPAAVLQGRGLTPPSSDLPAPLPPAFEASRVAPASSLRKVFAARLVFYFSPGWEGAPRPRGEGSCGHPAPAPGCAGGFTRGRSWGASRRKVEGSRGLGQTWGFFFWGWLLVFFLLESS